MAAEGSEREPRRSLAADDVSRMVGGSMEPRAQEMAEEAARAVGEEGISVVRLAREALRGTYSIRLQRYEEENVPECAGLAEFVAALRGPGDIEFLSFQTAERSWLSLFGSDGELLAALWVKRRRENEPERMARRS